MTISGDSTQPLLRVQNLEHSFTVEEETIHALRGVSFEIKAGEVTAVVGPSGCGKSTLLYLLGLLDRPQRGEIFLDDEFIGLVYVEDDEGEISYQFHMTILKEDLLNS